MLQFIQQRLENTAFTGFAGDEVENDDRIVLLAVAVDAAHALFQAGRIPGDIVVDHQPAELQVNPFTRGIRGQQVAGAPFGRRLAEESTCSSRSLYPCRRGSGRPPV